MINKPVIWIVVPVYERISYISKLVENLKKQTYQNYRLIIVDHGKSKIKMEFDKKAEVILASAELWWTGAINKGIKYILENKNIKPETPILIMNDDVSFDSNYLENMMLEWNYNEKKIIGSICIEPETSRIIYANMVLNRLKAKFEYKNKFKNINCLGNKPLLSDVLKGRGTLIPAKVFLEIGVYNEKFLPHYKADHELIYRAKKRGYMIYTSPRVILYSKLDSPHNLDKENKFKSATLVLFGRKSTSNIKDLFNYSYLSFDIFYGTYYFIINLLRTLYGVIKGLYLK